MPVTKRSVVLGGLKNCKSRGLFLYNIQHIGKKFLKITCKITKDFGCIYGSVPVSRLSRMFMTLLHEQMSRLKVWFLLFPQWLWVQTSKRNVIFEAFRWSLIANVFSREYCRHQAFLFQVTYRCPCVNFSFFSHHRWVIDCHGDFHQAPGLKWLWMNILECTFV